MRGEEFNEPGVQRLPTRRFAAFLGACLVGLLLLEDPLTVAGAAPDFAVIALVYGAVRWGALGGAVLGFVLGLFRDTLLLVDFGLHALVLTLLGYGVGKLREALYLHRPAIDLTLMAGAKLAVDILVLGVAASGAWVAFEQRFFWESPLAAIYTAVLGGVVYRLFASA